MAYEVWWALVLGFAISAIVQAWVPRERIQAALSGGGPRSVGWATALGAASSSCSYAAIAIAKSLFQKGASAASALAFQFASTNLVWELGLVLWVLLGWQFTLAEYVGGIVMIVLMTAALRASSRPGSRRRHGRTRSGPTPATSTRRLASGGWRERLSSMDAWSDVAHNFRGDWQMLWKEITAGFLIAGFVGLLGDDFFNSLFLKDAPAAGRDDRERPRRAAHRRAELRLLGRQHPPGRGPVVRRDQLRRRDGLHLRRPDRAADRPRLPQVLRLAVRAADHGPDVRDDGGRGACRRRASSARPA